MIIILVIILIAVILAGIVDKSSEFIFKTFYPLFSRNKFDRKYRKLICEKITNETIEEIGVVMKDMQRYEKNKMRINKLKKLENYD